MNARECGRVTAGRLWIATECDDKVAQAGIATECDDTVVQAGIATESDDTVAQESSPPARLCLTTGVVFGLLCDRSARFFVLLLALGIGY